MSDFIAQWPSPPNVTALTTTRHNGVSFGPFAHNNLAFHVEDNPESVTKNREKLIKSLCLPNEPLWLEQTHSTHCLLAETAENNHADAAVTRDKARVLAIMTADCLPILLCQRDGQEIAAIHAGWRGLANGIIENTLRCMKYPPNTLMAWIGPGICGKCYAVGQEVRDRYLARYPFVEEAFQFNHARWYANLAKAAELILHYYGITDVYQSEACTFEQEHEFYSYRRNTNTGRMATLIWFNDYSKEL